MNDIGYNVLNEKVEALCNQSRSLLGETSSSQVNESKQHVEIVAPLNLVFAGQYNAGKSSLIKMLTGIEGIKIGAGVTTEIVTKYKYKSMNIWDTPGILAGKCEQHDEKALEAIAKADLLVYVITNELFDDVVGAAFRDLCFAKGRAKEIMIVINKSESDSADRVTKIDGISQVLEPKIPEDFFIVFTDAQSFFDAIDEEDEEEKNELLEVSNSVGLSKAIDDFVAQRGLYARLTTPLSLLQKDLESQIDDLDVSDPLRKGVISLLNQSKRVFNESKRTLNKKITAILDSMNSGIVEQGNILADSLNSDIDEDEFEKTQEQTQEQRKFLRKKALDDIQQAVSDCQSDLETELQEISDSPLAIKIKEAIDGVKDFDAEVVGGDTRQFSKDEQFKLNNTLNKTLVGSADKGLSWLAKSAINDASKSGLKAVSGSKLHLAVKEIGGFFGYKFESYGAIKIADKIGKGAKFLGPATAIFGVGMQVLDDYQQAELAKKIRDKKKDIRKTYREFAEKDQVVFELERDKLVDEAFNKPISNIEAELTNIRNQSETTSKDSDILKVQLSRVIDLRNEIQNLY